MSVTQITYISTRHPTMADGDVEAILASARRNNLAHGLTGLLLFNGQRFLQHIEGPEDRVDAVFERIKADPRHRAVVLLDRRQATERAFPHWGMAYEAVTPTGDDTAMAQLSLGDQVRAMVEGVPPSVAAHFKGFAALTNGRAA